VMHHGRELPKGSKDQRPKNLQKKADPPWQID
jgi:hypothetical protein